MKVVFVLNESTANKTVSLLLAPTGLDLPAAPTDRQQVLAWAARAVAEHGACFSIVNAEKCAFAAPHDNLIPPHLNSTLNEPQVSSQLQVTNEQPQLLQVTTEQVQELQVTDGQLQVKDFELVASNDIYLRFLRTHSEPQKVVCMHPCTLKHIQKYLVGAQHIVLESPTDYAQITRPWIDAIPQQQTQWVANILAGTAESADVVHADANPHSGFVLLPDQKWDRVSVDSLYLLAIARDPAIRSLRDLHAKHAAVLRTMRTSIHAAVLSLYGVAHSQLRLFVHYHPTYFRFHIHVVMAQADATEGMVCGKAHLLEDIIDCLELYPAYYQQRTLAVSLSANHDLYTLLRNNQTQRIE